MERERTINLEDLFWSVCSHWKSIIVMMLIGIVAAVVLNIQDAKSSDIPETTQEIAEIGAEPEPKPNPKPEEIELTQEEKDGITLYKSYKEVYVTQREYNQNSPLMQVDARDFYQSVLSYSVMDALAREEGMTAQKAEVIRREIMNDSLNQKVAEILASEELDETYYPEVVNAWTDKGIVNIVVRCLDEAKCNEVTEMIKKHVEELDLAAKYGTTTINFLGETAGRTRNAGIISHQQNNLISERNILATLNDIRNNLSENQKLYMGEEVEAVAEEPETEEEPEPTITAEPQKTTSKGVRVIFGCVVGIIVMAGFWGAKYILDGKLKMGDDFENSYGVRLLGKTELGANEKARGLDKYLVQKRFERNYVSASADAVEGILIRLLREKCEGKKVFITGSENDEQWKAFCEQLAERMKDIEVEATIGNNVLKDMKAFRAMSETGTVILVEEFEKSRHQNIVQELDACRGLNILGCVLLAE